MSFTIVYIFLAIVTAVVFFRWSTKDDPHLEVNDVFFEAFACLYFGAFFPILWVAFLLGVVLKPLAKAYITWNNKRLQ